MSGSDPYLNYLILPIDGMTCASCSARVKKSLDSVSWIKSADVNLAAEQAAIGYSGPFINAEDLKKTIRDAGYTIRLRTSEIVIPGFTDPTKIKSLQQALNNIPGLEDTSFNAANETLSLKYIPGIIAVTAVEKKTVPIKRPKKMLHRSVLKSRYRRPRFWTSPLIWLKARKEMTKGIPNISIRKIDDNRAGFLSRRKFVQGSKPEVLFPDCVVFEVSFGRGN